MVAISVMKIRSRSPKSNKLLILSDLYRLANLVTFHPMVYEVTCRQTHFGFGGLSLAVTLKIRSRSQKPIQLFIMSKCFIHANLVKIRRLVHAILCTQAPFGSNLAVLSPAVTLKNRSRSPKPNQHFIMSQCYIDANVVQICQPIHETQTLFGLNLAV